MKLKGDANKRALIRDPKSHPRKIPLLDTRLKRWAGKPSKVHRVASKRVVKMIRLAVNTQAFEYSIVALFNSKSRLRKRIKKQPPIGVL